MNFYLGDKVIFQFNYQGIGKDVASIDWSFNGEDQERPEDIKLKNPTYASAIQDAINKAIVKIHANDLPEFKIRSVSHRVVHGAEELVKTEEVNGSSINVIDGVKNSAPLHNPPNLLGIIAMYQVLLAEEGINNFPEIKDDLSNLDNVIHFIASKLKTLALPPMAVILDTAPHVKDMKSGQYTLPFGPEARKIFRTLYGGILIRKAGFHGSSYGYIKDKYKIENGIIAHIGNGQSIAGIIDGKFHDTTMSFTPLAGLVMGSRTGNFDPALAIAMVKSIMTKPTNALKDKINEILKLSDKAEQQEAALDLLEELEGKYLKDIEGAPKSADTIFNKQSGLQGLTKTAVSTENMKYLHAYVKPKNFSEILEAADEYGDIFVKSKFNKDKLKEIVIAQNGATEDMYNNILRILTYHQGTNNFQEIRAIRETEKDPNGPYHTALAVWKNSLIANLAPLIVQLPLKKKDLGIYFTGGMGENEYETLIESLQDMPLLNFKPTNKKRVKATARAERKEKGIVHIATGVNKIKVFMVTTDEEGFMINETRNMIDERYGFDNAEILVGATAIGGQKKAKANNEN